MGTRLRNWEWTQCVLCISQAIQSFLHHLHLCRRAAQRRSAGTPFVQHSLWCFGARWSQNTAVDCRSLSQYCCSSLSFGGFGWWFDCCGGLRLPNMNRCSWPCLTNAREKTKKWIRENCQRLGIYAIAKTSMQRGPLQSPSEARRYMQNL